MKKLIKLLIVGATLAMSHAATLTLTNNNITSTVSETSDGQYRYEYNIRPRDFSNDIISEMEIQICSDGEITRTAVRDIEMCDDTIVWSFKANQQNSRQTFWFISPNAPKLGEVTILSKKDQEWKASAYVMSCNVVPETSTALLGAMGALFLLRRKR
jgi:hypothetical protein